MSLLSKMIGGAALAAAALALKGNKKSAPAKAPRTEASKAAKKPSARKRKPARARRAKRAAR